MNTEANIDITKAVEEMRDVARSPRMEFFMLNPSECAGIVAKLDEQARRIAEHEQADAEVRRLTRELDVLLNGQEGAAQQAALCDLVSRAKVLVARWKSAIYPALLDACRRIAELEAKTVWFVGVNPLNPVAGAVMPMIPASWRFGFKSDGDNQGCAMRFGFFDDGPFVAWDAIKDQVAFAERAKSDAGRFHTEEEGDAYTHGFFEGEQYAKTELEAAAAKPARSLHHAIADAIRPYLSPGERVIFRAPFRWLNQDGHVLPNHYEHQGIEYLAQEWGYEIVHNFNHVAVIKGGPNG